MSLRRRDAAARPRRAPSGALRLLLVAAIASGGCERGRAWLEGPPPGAAASGVPSVASPAPAPPLAFPAAPADSPPPPLVPGGPGGSPLSFAPLARRADPAVVAIKNFIERPGPRGRRYRVGEGLGSGFVYDPEGFILTNNHVIEDASEILVILHDKRELSGKVVGRDKGTDIAVIKVEERSLSSLPLGDSDALSIGDWVVAIGNPYGLSHTVSAGILSAKGRTADDVKGLDPNGYYHFLQTDASINPGNSGGPLLDLEGRVVGINAAVRKDANGIGFAIPINMVKQLLPLLLRDGRVRRSKMGVVVDPLDAIEATRLSRPDRKGAWVKEVVAGGPGHRAGLAPDDVIIGFEGKPVADPNELRWLVSIAGSHRVVTLRVARADRAFDLKVKLVEREEEPSEADPSEGR